MPAEPAGGPVTVRYWAAARAAAGVDADTVMDCETVGDVIASAGRLHPALVPVAQVSTLLLDGRAAGRDAPLTPGAVVEVLPPFAGG